MEEIPTAERLITIEVRRDIGDLKAYLLTTEKVIALMKDFAKLHVEAALKAASENAKVKEYLEGDPMFGKVITIVDKESILSAYPPENIK